MVQVDRWFEEEMFAQQELERWGRKNINTATVVTKNSKEDKKGDIIQSIAMV